MSFTDPLGLSRMNPIATQVQSYFAGVSQSYTSLSDGTGTASVGSGLGGSNSSGRVFFADSGETASDGGRDMIGGSATSCGQRLCNQIGTAPGPLEVLDLGTNLVAPEAKLGIGIGAIVKGVVKGAGTHFKDFNQAQNAALKWLEPRGFKAEQPTIGKLGDNAGKPIGMKSADGSVGFRGAHINVWAGKEKGPHITFEGDRSMVNQIVKQYVKER